MLAHLAPPLLRLFPPETAHALALAALRAGIVPAAGRPPPSGLAIRALGRDFPNPIGLAAGFDKNAAALPALLRLGFGFVEAGTVTPRAQPGNPRPRLFRLPAHRAVINRMGFNNAGIGPFRARLRALAARPAPVGVNLGINKDGAEPLRDYPALAAAVAPFADYVAINLSSPNTPGLRALQSEAHLTAIVRAIRDAVPAPPPLLVKLAPDLPDEAFLALIDTALALALDGLILTNTSLARPPGLAGRHAAEAGGLSGPPLFARSTEMLRLAHRRAAGRLTLIGVGGVASGADVLAKIEAGATLVQLYTAFAYGGPALIPRLLRDFAAALAASGHASVAAAIGARA